ncbi:MAG: alpha/beta fold hydrolase [bacterium]|nr:alpha/beta fold hydrolase [bacterium]
MPFVETARVPFYIIDQRRYPDALPLVLIHGAGGSHLDWPIALRRLPGANLVLPDLPGHGKSPLPGRDSIAAYAADVMALLDALGIERAIFVGHSMGGGVALQLALDDAERAAGLVLVGTGAKLGVSPEIMDRLQVDQAGVANLLAEWYWSADTPPERRALTVQYLLAQSVELLYNDYLACTRFDVRQRLPEIRVPTLIFAATEDRMTPLKFGQYLQINISGAELVTLEGAGHMMALEQPQQVVEAVQAWLHTHFLGERNLPTCSA